MKATPLAIPDVILLEPKVFGDDRGFFFESFNQAKFEAAIGIITTVMMFLSPVFYPVTAVPESSAIHHGQPTYLHHRAGARSADLGAFAELDGIGYLHSGCRCHRLGRLRLVPKNQKGVC